MLGLRMLTVVLACAWLTASPLAAGTTQIPLETVFPGADRIGPPEGSPPAYPVYHADQKVGFAFLSKDVGVTSGFAGRPLDVAVGLSLDGIIKGATLIEHHEPILIIGISDEGLHRFVGQYVGVDVRRTARLRPLTGTGAQAIDGIGGATVTSLALNDAIMTSARVVARARGLLGGSADRLDLDSFQPKAWPTLMQSGAIAQRTVTVGEVERALRAAGDNSPALAGASPPNAAFVTLYAALATPAETGINLLGESLYRRLMADAAPGSSLVFVASTGLYSFKGSSWLRTGDFERLQLVQGATTLRFNRDQHHRVERIVAADAPDLREAALFVVPPESGLDPTKPWRLDLLVAARGTSGEVSAIFELPYSVPPHLIVRGAAASAEIAEDPLWRQMWEARWPRVVILMAALAALTTILFVQDFVAQRRDFWWYLRLGAATFTLVWLGWFAGAQLSVVNVLTFAGSLLSKFEWEFFLREPLIFILWGYVAVALLFWGRGVFCGWLCPFGALQELANRAARYLKIPQIAVPFGLHERLWPIKYVAFLALFAVSLGSMLAAIRGAEIEPFKTAINLGFRREWYFVGYAVLLLVIGLFLERFFCRYLCPLGAALAIPARLRMFEWLKRHWQCGRECQICATRCPVQAIQPDGRINPNECIYCLKCQTLYFDDQTCPPLIARRKRREERAAMRKGTIKPPGEQT